MVTKKRKSRHRIPVEALVLRSDPVDGRYQREVDAATNRLERRYRRAVQAREKAQQRLSVAAASNAKVSCLTELRRQLEIREYELAEIEKLMQPGNRARVAWRPVPVVIHQ